MECYTDFAKIRTSKTQITRVNRGQVHVAHQGRGCVWRTMITRDATQFANQNKRFIIVGYKHDTVKIMTHKHYDTVRLVITPDVFILLIANNTVSYYLIL